MGNIHLTNFIWNSSIFILGYIFQILISKKISHFIQWCINAWIWMNMKCFSFKKLHWKMASAKCLHFCWCFSVLCYQYCCFIKFLDLANLTHWGWDKMAAISQATFSNIFSWMKMFEFPLIFHWSLVLKVQLTISIGSVYNGLAPNRQQAIIWTNVGLVYRCICVTRPRWVRQIS